jgi:cytochrome P450
MRAAPIDEELEALFAGEPAAMQDPYPLYRRLREESPVHMYGGAAAIVSRHREAKTVFRESSRFPNPGRARGAVRGAAAAPVGGGAAAGRRARRRPERLTRRAHGAA